MSDPKDESTARFARLMGSDGPAGSTFVLPDIGPSGRILPPALCFRCDEMVLPSDKRQWYSNIPTPVHQACFMRPIIGSVAHIEKRCGCFVPGAEDNDDPALTRRQAAEAALAAWEKLERSAFDDHSFPCEDEDE